MGTLPFQLLKSAAMSIARGLAAKPSAEADKWGGPLPVSLAHCSHLNIAKYSSKLNADVIVAAGKYS